MTLSATLRMVAYRDDLSFLRVSNTPRRNLDKRRKSGCWPLQQSIVSDFSLIIMYNRVYLYLTYVVIKKDTNREKHIQLQREKEILL